MIRLYEYLLSKKNPSSGGVKATDDNIEQLVLDSIKQYGTAVDLNFIDTSAVTNMSNLFDQEDFEGDVSGWDVSNVTTMQYMFSECKHFRCDLSQWNTRKVTDMHSMFRNCNEFDGKCLENWDVSKVLDMDSMFFNCESFNADLSRWDLSTLKYASHMFRGCINFEGKGLDKWSTPMLAYIAEMFSGCKKFDQDLSKWHTKNMMGWSYWAYDTPIFNHREKWPKFP